MARDDDRQRVVPHGLAGRAGRQGLDDEGHVFSVINLEEDTPKGVKDVVFGMPHRDIELLIASGI